MPNLIDIIRDICAREFDALPDFQFFSAHIEPGETTDEMILRVFFAEHRGRELTIEAIEETVMVMCHG